MLQDATGLIAIDALGPTGPYHTRRRLTINDVAGTAVAELSLVPRLFVDRAMNALRKAPTMPLGRRLDALDAAGRMFRDDTVDGLSRPEYEHLVSRVSGLPITAVRKSTELIATEATNAYRNAQYAKPRGAVTDWNDPLARTGTALWTRRGDVLAVLPAGNHPAVHAAWLEALALGFRVAIRPSRREPFTPYRLISALRSVGFADDQIVMLPTDHEEADALLQGADLGIVYGSDDVIQKYATQPGVLAMGPGRSKILVTAGVDWELHLDVIVDSIAYDGGVGCVNTTTVLVEGDPVPLARAVSKRLATLPSLPPEDEHAQLPVAQLADAQRLENYMLSKAAGANTLLGGSGIIDQLPDTSAVLRPAVHVLDAAYSPAANVELPFPCVWFAQWSGAIDVLSHSLVLTTLTDDHALICRLMADPTIANAYVGPHPTFWSDAGIPHDGYQADFLMRTKGVIRG